jgi:hypothetical protein
MIIHIEGFNHKNEYFEQDININNEPLYMLTNWSDYDWFQDGTELDCMFCEWSKDITYTLYYNKNKYIRLRLVRYNLNYEHNIISPLISTDIKVKELKDILSIKDNIYFRNTKMNETKTLKYYNINNMDTLVYGTLPLYAVAGAAVPADC